MAKINRKEFLKTAAAITAGSILLPGCKTEDQPLQGESPAIITDKKFRWYMVTTWPPNFPIIGSACQRFAQKVLEMSGGQLEIKVYGADELIPALEVFEAVSSGTAQAGHGAAYYWTGKVPAAQFFTTVPFGLNAMEQTTWINHGGGIELWRKIYSKYNLRPYIGGNTGVQMGGWFNKEINSIEDFRSLKMRIPGLAGRILKEVGATPVLVAGGEIYTNLERGVIDAIEWLGPYHDQMMGFQDIARYYYTPGWHEPGSSLEMIVHQGAYDELPAHLQQIVDVCAGYINDWMMTEMFYKNGMALEELHQRTEIEIRNFSPETLATLKEVTDDTIAGMAAKDPEIHEVYNSFLNFKTMIRSYSNVSEKLYYTLLQ